MFCPRCGAENAERAIRCARCGGELALPPPSAVGAVGAAAPGALGAGFPNAPAPVAGPSAIEVLIPYRNGAALTAYYLGVFSIVCGLLLGIPALVLGIMGLRFAKLHPEARGKAHAWIGIVLGSLTTLVSLVLIGLAAASFLAARR